MINPQNVSPEEAATYKVRIAVRAIVVDSENNIALLQVTRDNYYKLPGGGVEMGEDMYMALARECKEEIGCRIEVIEEIGQITEYWKEDGEKQISHCFLAKLVGDKGIPELTESEMERGFETVWISYEKAVSILNNIAPTQWEGNYIVPRELMFLREVRDKFK